MIREYREGVDQLGKEVAQLEKYLAGKPRPLSDHDKQELEKLDKKRKASESKSEEVGALLKQMEKELSEIDEDIEEQDRDCLQ
jgi:septal ring factor EnvC (AmiA/AmiB activator)